MARLSDFAEQAELNRFRGIQWARPSAGAGIHLALGEAVGDDTGIVTEATYNGYARLLVPQDDAEWAPSTTTNGQRITSDNAAGLSFAIPGVGGPYNQVVSVFALDSVTGDLLMYGDLSTPVTPSAGDSLDFPVGSLSFELGNANQELIDGYALAVLDHIFRSTPLPNLTQYQFDLVTTMPSKAGAGGVVYSGNAYAPQIRIPAAGDWTPPGVPGSMPNAVLMQFPAAPSSDWLNIAGQILGDGTNIFRRKQFVVAKNYTAGNIVAAKPGQLILTAA